MDMFDAVAARVGTLISKELLLPPMLEIFEHCNKINEDSEGEADTHPVQHLLALRKKVMSKGDAVRCCCGGGNPLKLEPARIITRACVQACSCRCASVAPSRRSS